MQHDRNEEKAHRQGAFAASGQCGKSGGRIHRSVLPVGADYGLGVMGETDEIQTQSIRPPDLYAAPWHFDPYCADFGRGDGESVPYGH